jgi:hypothetical protein
MLIYCNVYTAVTDVPNFLTFLPLIDRYSTQHGEIQFVHCNSALRGDLDVINSENINNSQVLYYLISSVQTFMFNERIIISRIFKFELDRLIRIGR